MGWALAAGGGMWAVMIGAVIFGKKEPVSPDECPECHHEAGLDNRRKRCGDAEHDSGWSSSFCHCQNDYHWNYESTVVA